MNRFSRFIALSTVAGVLSSGAVLAQDDHHDAEHHEDADHHDNHAYVEHKEWKKGYLLRGRGLALAAKRWIIAPIT